MKLLAVLMAFVMRVCWSQHGLIHFGHLEMKNFIISGQKQVEMFVDAIENSANNRPVRTPVSARQIKGEAELRKFMEKRKKADVGQR